MNQPRPARRQQLQRQDEISDSNNENEANADADTENEQPLENAIETFVIDLTTQTSRMDNVNSNNNMNVVNDIRSLAAAIAADAAMPNCVDDVLILQYAQSNHNCASNIYNNNNSSNNNFESQLMHFNGIHIRNNTNSNAYVCSCTNRFICDHIQSCQLPSPPEGSCDNARSCLFQSSVSAINDSELIRRNHDLPLISGNARNAVADMSIASEAAEPPDGVSNVDAINGSAVGEPLLLALASPNADRVNSAPVAGSPRESNELTTPEYLRHRRHSRRSRRRRGHGHNYRARQRHQIRRSLKSMNNILRKTAYTLRRIKSLIMQQLQMARDYRMNVAMAI